MTPSSLRGGVVTRQLTEGMVEVRFKDTGVDPIPLPIDCVVPDTMVARYLSGDIAEREGERAKESMDLLMNDSEAAQQLEEFKDDSSGVQCLLGLRHASCYQPGHAHLDRSYTSDTIGAPFHYGTAAAQEKANRVGKRNVGLELLNKMSMDSNRGRSDATRGPSSIIDKDSPEYHSWVMQFVKGTQF